MKKIIGLLIALASGTGVFIFINSCAATQAVAEKSGTQLWGENCVRCHNAPPSSDYSPAQWETVSMHMKLRANLTEYEINKIQAFLK